MAQYGQVSYWDQRYTKDPEPFDWYQRYAGVKELLEQHIEKHSTILQVGCGNSRMTEEMYADGFKFITNIDVSSTVISQMKDKYDPEKYPGLDWQVMDCTDMKLGDTSFHALVDKGTLDSILCGDNSTANVAKYCKEASRVLQPDGVFFIVSYGTPENRMSYLEQEDYEWSVNVHTIAKPTVSTAASADASDASSVHYIYVCQKR